MTVKNALTPEIIAPFLPFLGSFWGNLPNQVQYALTKVHIEVNINNHALKGVVIETACYAGL